MATNLAPVYVNDNRVTLQGDPKPQVSKIIEACGKQPNAVEIVRLTSRKDVQGKILKPEEFIDRAAAEGQPVYLKCVDRNEPSSAASGSRNKSGKWTAGAQKQSQADTEGPRTSFSGGSRSETSSLGSEREPGQPAKMYDPHKETGRAGPGHGKPDVDSTFGSTKGKTSMGPDEDDDA